MTNLLEEAKLRYCNAVPEGNELAAAFRADVGYLLQRLASAERAIERGHFAGWDHRNSYRAVGGGADV